MKRIGVGLAIILTIVLMIPAAVIFVFKGSSPSTPSSQGTVSSVKSNQIPITVYRVEKKKVETYPMEDYVVGVVAAEMPAEFELEALKAQAMAARTYIVRRMTEKNYTDVPEGAYVTDTIKHQVFLDDAQCRSAWGKDYDWKIQKLRQAVDQTAGQILTYDAKPIDATFFSVSNGYTENSEDYWGQKIPYLRSVEVPWDKKSPKYQNQVEISLTELENKLGVRITAAASTSNTWWKVLEESSGKRIAKVKIADKVFTGREIREKLGLASTSFQWQVHNGRVDITTFGSGHGVGMSQWGANGMAEQGKKSEEIVKYFYQGIAIEDYHKWIKIDPSKKS